MQYQYHINDRSLIDYSDDNKNRNPKVPILLSNRVNYFVVVLLNSPVFRIRTGI